MSRRRRRNPGRGLLLLTSLVAALVLACSGSDTPPATATPATSVARLAPAATPGPTRPPAATATAAPAPTPAARPFPPDLEQQARQILDRVAAIRDTPPKGDVAMNLIGRRAAIDYYRDSYDAEDIAATELRQEVYRLLGLLEPDDDLFDAFLNLLDLGIAGFYEPDFKAFYLLDDLGGLDSGASRTTIVHELVHALQDQYHDLNAIGETLEDDWDAAHAFTNLIEGDAVHTETAFFGFALRSRPTCFSVPPVLRLGSLPYVVVRELNSWYDDGVCFVEAVLPRLDDQIERLYADPPTTTEQVLHPEKYLAGEGARPVDLTPREGFLGDDWAVLGRGTLGEFTLQNILVIDLDDRRRVGRAAAGWGGDGWAFYGRTDGARLVEVVTLWDSAADATEFWQAFVDALKARDGSQLNVDATASDLSGRVDGQVWKASLNGDRVAFLVSTDAATADRLAPRLGLP